MGGKWGDFIPWGSMEGSSLLCPQLQAWEGSSEMSEASLLAHQKGLTPGHIQKLTPHMGDGDYVWGGAWVWLDGVWALHCVLMTLISKSPKT